LVIARAQSPVHGLAELMSGRCRDEFPVGRWLVSRAQLAIARTILGLGMGGEWASGALLVSETWPAQHRGKAIGFMQSGWAIGYIAAAIAGTTVLPALGWRAMFFVGIAPALFTLWIRRRVEEPEIWLAARRSGTVSRPGLAGFTRISIYFLPETRGRELT
jgi:MFS family permease